MEYMSMRNPDRQQDGLINVWVTLSDAVLGFMIIILLLFTINTVRLNKLANYAKTAQKDRAELKESLKARKGLVGFISPDTLSVEYEIVLPDSLVWVTSGRTGWTDISKVNQDKIIEFCRVLKGFMDKKIDWPEDNKIVKKERYKIYSLLVVGHASAENEPEDMPGQTGTNSFALKRAVTIFEKLTEVFSLDPLGDDEYYGWKVKGSDVRVENQLKYKIYATGVGERQLRNRNNPSSKDNRYVEIRLIPDFLNFSK